MNARDPEGQTPLHIATSLARVDVVKLLLSQPAIVSPGFLYSVYSASDIILIAMSTG